jgi:antitoxin component YwqK of YwqJK toxin-antitoxin module
MLKADFEYVRRLVKSGKAIYKEGTQQVYYDPDTTVECVEQLDDDNVSSNHYLVRSFYPNGSNKSAIMYADCVLDGPYIQWHENGNVWQKGQYKDGIQQGKWLIYYSNGSLQFEQEYKDGRRLK